LRTDGWMAARSILSPMGQIHGETLGLLAFGRIGKQTAKRALAMDMKVIAYDPYLEPDVFTSNGVESVGYEELAERSDYVSCHLPLNDETRKMVDARFFSMMKPSAYFINTSRGAVVNEPDLIAALREHKIAGAGLDVFDVEPISPDHPLCKMNNVVLAPHSASWADKTMEMQKIRIGRDALRVARGGMPDFIANPEVLSKLRTWK
jgi:D-3-phosphoglycerate dehydrogenase / 2-oxoglutarate reductase